MQFPIAIATVGLLLTNCNARFAIKSADHTQPTGRADAWRMPGWLPRLWPQNNQTGSTEASGIQKMLGWLFKLGQTNNQTLSTGGSAAQELLKLLGSDQETNKTGSAGGSDVQCMLGGHTGFGDVIVNVLNRINVIFTSSINP